MRTADQPRPAPGTYRCPIDRTIALSPAIGMANHWATTADEVAQLKNTQHAVRCRCRSPALVPRQEELGAKPQGLDLGFGHTQAHRALAQAHYLVSRTPVKSAHLQSSGAQASTPVRILRKAS